MMQAGSSSPSLRAIIKNAQRDFMTDHAKHVAAVGFTLVVASTVAQRWGNKLLAAAQKNL
jgi:hypothetical protein